MYEIGKEAVFRLGDEAPLYESEAERTAAFKWAASSQSKSAIENLVALSRSSLPISPDELDRDPYLFNTVNGTLNLKSMEFTGHREEDYITKMAGVVMSLKPIALYGRITYDWCSTMMMNSSPDFRRCAGILLLPEPGADNVYSARDGEKR